MGLFKKIQRQSFISRLSEEVLYEQVAQELAEGAQRQGLMAKAMANANGDPDKTRAFYIKYRVQSMRDESEIESVVREQREAQTHADDAAAREQKEAQANADEAAASKQREAKARLLDEPVIAFFPLLLVMFIVMAFVIIS